MNRQRLLYLIDQYKAHTATPEEQEELDNWYAQLGTPLEETGVEARRQRIWRKLIRHGQLAPLRRQKRNQAQRVSWINRIPYGWAAAILLILSGALIYTQYVAPPQTSEALMTAALKDVTPGSNKAMLTLSDGSTVDLDTWEEGKPIHEPGLNMTKTADGVLTYQPKASAGGEPHYHTISTPRGGQYQVVLPDGTIVWLNAESTLTYPAVFSKDQRLVQLTGEAYFEVSKHTDGQKQIPFRVKTVEQEVQVLGTHFNVKAYADESETTTTLLEGSVKVIAYQKGDQAGQAYILQVGQASHLQNGQYDIHAVDVEKAVAWKNGKFIFSGNIKAIMNNISRWYDVAVEYRGDLSHANFEGSVSRYENIVEVLRKLELTGTVHFKIVSSDQSNENERRIIVMP